jgi:multiple sugar transport system permease protein
MAYRRGSELGYKSAEMSYMGKHKHFRLRNKDYIILFIAPAIIALVLLTIYPLIYSLYISMTNWNLGRPSTRNNFVLFDNYSKIFKSKEFWQSLIVTLKLMTSSVIASVIVGTSLAFLMYQKLRGNTIVRSFIIGAMIMAPIVVGTSWRLMYDPQWGLVNYILGLIGIHGQPFLAQQNTVIPAIVVVEVWQWSPLVMIIVLTALQTRPMEVYESAKIDGASHLQILLRVTLPLIKPSLLLAILIRTMDSFRTFDIIYAMTKGGPGIHSQNINILMYNTGFENFNVGMSAAMALIALIIVSSVCTLVLKFSRTKGA